MRTNLTAAALSLALVLAANAAFAHAQLEKSTPPVGGVVAPPSAIRLEFSEGVEPKFSGLTLTGPAGPAGLGAPSVESSAQNVLVVPILRPLAAGLYTVKWHAVSVDTHHTQGTFQFTVK